MREGLAGTLKRRRLYTDPGNAAMTGDPLESLKYVANTAHALGENNRARTRWCKITALGGLAFMVVR